MLGYVSLLAWGREWGWVDAPRHFELDGGTVFGQKRSFDVDAGFACGLATEGCMAG